MLLYVVRVAAVLSRIIEQASTHGICSSRHITSTCQQAGRYSCLAFKHNIQIQHHLLFTVLESRQRALSRLQEMAAVLSTTLFHEQTLTLRDFLALRLSESAAIARVVAT